MKKILVLTEEFREMTNATGVCTKASIDVLAQNNHVIVLSMLNSFKSDFPHKYAGIRVEYQNNAWWELKHNKDNPSFIRKPITVMRKARNLFMKPFYPIGDVSPFFRFYKKACYLHKKYNFDIVLCFFHPFESFIVGGMLKKRYPELRVVHYMLDTLLNYTPSSRLLSKKFIHDRNLKLEKWGYSHCDNIINLIVQKRSYDMNPDYDEFRDKMLYADIPLLKKRPQQDNKSIQKGTMIYAGSLVKAFRDPSYALKLFSSLPNKYRATIYCSGDCNDIVDTYSKKYETIIMGGYIQHDLLEKKMEEAEVLINFGNYKLNMIPSKIFEYFSFEKKIIHFYKDDDDTCIPYLKKYPYALLIDERNSLEENLKKMIDFLEKEIKHDDDQNWRGNFYMNTPEYSAKLILNGAAK